MIAIPINGSARIKHTRQSPGGKGFAYDKHAWNSTLQIILLILPFAITITTGGCDSTQKVPPKTVESAWESSQPTSAVPEDQKESPTQSTALLSESVPDPEDVIATVNGLPIQRSKMITMLLENHGLRLLEQEILLLAAKHKAAEMSLTVTKADIAAAHEDALRRLSSSSKDTANKSMDRTAAEKLLEQFLQAKNISPDEWQLRMQQRAYIHKIAKAEVEKTKITEDMLREQYDITYGERVRIRHIQAASLAEVTRIRALLAQKDFEWVAREYSQNQLSAARGGLIPPFTRHDTSITPLIRETAFKMKVGDISPAIQESNAYHIIKLEERIPGGKESFDQVNKEELRKQLLDRLLEQYQDTLEADLFQKAKVEIHDKILKKQFREKYGDRTP